MTDIVNEYRKTMDSEVLHSWAQDAIAEIKSLRAKLVKAEFALSDIDRVLGNSNRPESVVNQVIYVVSDYYEDNSNG